MSANMLTSACSIQKLLGSLQERMYVYCDAFLENKDALPGWVGDMTIFPLVRADSPQHELPAKLRSAHWPKVYSLELESSRTFVSSILRYSICKTIMEHVLIPVPFCTCATVRDVTNVLHQSDRSHEAIWRLMTASSMIKTGDVVDSAEARSRDIAEEMIESWKLHLQPELRSEMQAGLVGFLMACLMDWLQLMRLGDRVIVIASGNSELFDFEGAVEVDRAVKVPGEFSTSVPSLSSLCIFPAFLQISGTSGGAKQHIIRKGTMLHSNSIVFQQARHELAAASNLKPARRLTLASSSS